MIIIDPKMITCQEDFSLHFKKDKNVLFLEVGDKKTSVPELYKKLEKEHGPRFRGAIVYSVADFIDNIRKFSDILKNHFNEYAVVWAIKSAPIPELIRAVAGLPIGFEVGSYEELKLVIDEGIEGDRIYHTGTGKFDWDIDAIVQHNCISISDNLVELVLINDKAKLAGKIIDVGIRINPSIESDTHSAIATGTIDCKFGIPEISSDFLKTLGNLKHINVSILHMHIGSQVSNSANYQQALVNLLRVYRTFKQNGFNIETIDIGGGFPHQYSDNAKSDLNATDQHFSNCTDETLDSYIKKIKETLVLEFGSNIPIIATEPGRKITAGTAFTLGYVLDSKIYPNGFRWLITSVNINDLWLKEITQTLYFNVEVLGKDTSSNIPTAIAGTLCFAGDVLTPFGISVNLPQKVERGDVVIFMNTGAYSLLGAGNFHGIPRLPVYIIDEKLKISKATTPV